MSGNKPKPKGGGVGGCSNIGHSDTKANSAKLKLGLS